MNKTCTVGEKHKWTFVKNGVRTTSTGGMGGGGMRISLRGLYRCECGATRVGQPNHNAPGNDVRDHMDPKQTEAA